MSTIPAPVTTIGSVTDAGFTRDVLMHDLPVLVEFWAQWCPPCHRLGPVLAELAVELSDRLVIRRMNSDENPVTTRDHSVLSVPTMVLFRGGIAVHQMVGFRPKSRLRAELDAVLAG